MSSDTIATEVVALGDAFIGGAVNERGVDLGKRRRNTTTAMADTRE
jgi:hypothetical protein